MKHLIMISPQKTTLPHPTLKTPRRYLTPHIGGTPVWNMWLRSLGARIGQGCVIDTNNINEPDLISIGHNVLVAEDAFVSAATIVPPGFVDENGELGRVAWCGFGVFGCLGQ
jgi:hypothetical protein